jgi:hypothetical protein
VGTQSTNAAQICLNSQTIHAIIWWLLANGWLITHECTLSQQLYRLHQEKGQ